MFAKHPREHELAEAEVFRTVRRVARDDVRAATSLAADHPLVRAARAAVETATRVEELLDAEPLVEGALVACGLHRDPRRPVQIGDRFLRWEQLGGYAAVAEAARAEPAGVTRGPDEDALVARGKVEGSIYEVGGWGG
jgi:hypothetical protein